MTDPASLRPNTPLWHLQVSDEDYSRIKRTLCDNRHLLDQHGMEAAIFYAEWWRREYCGGTPSKEAVAQAAGLGQEYAADLFNAARKALKSRGYTFITSNGYTQYFRTLLNQGGLPIAYIQANGLGNFTRFLAGLIRELSRINYDWRSGDVTFIDNLTCATYLGQTFRNDNIYDIALQIAHAIINEDHSLLPYDNSEDSLAGLTQALAAEYSRSKTQGRRNLTLRWKLLLDSDCRGRMLVSMDTPKEIAASSIPGFDHTACSEFDIYVADVHVGKYKLKRVDDDDATYGRITAGMAKEIVWRGEPMVDVKVKCGNGRSLYPPVAGYPPNFDSPQLFQLLHDNVYAKAQTAHAAQNVAVYSADWHADAGESRLSICGRELSVCHFSDTVRLTNADTGEQVTLTNEFTPYSVEYSLGYIDWLESSNYKILTSAPRISVYDGEGNRDVNAKAYFRAKGADTWQELTAKSRIPLGLIETRVDFRDDHHELESFYNVGRMTIASRNETADSTELICQCDGAFSVAIERCDGLDIMPLEDHAWHISRPAGALRSPARCTLAIYKAGERPLRISVAIPFRGLQFADTDGNTICGEKVISLSELSQYCIVCHGGGYNQVTISYWSGMLPAGTRVIELSEDAEQGIVPLSHYRDRIERMFHRYGANSFDRSSSVILRIVGGRAIKIRRFMLDSELMFDSVWIKGGEYHGSVYAVSVDEPVTRQSFSPVPLTSQGDKCFCFPEDFTARKVIVFSGPETAERIIPKFYDRSHASLTVEERCVQAQEIIADWSDRLRKGNIIDSVEWYVMCEAFEVCSRYELPFNTFNGFKAIRNEPLLLAKFMLAMFMADRINLLRQDIEAFEQELATAIHWIPRQVWAQAIGEMLDALPAALQNLHMPRLLNFLPGLFSLTLSAEVAPEFTNYISGGTLPAAGNFTDAEIRDYRSRVHGLADDSADLPFARIDLQQWYFSFAGMRPHHMAMFASALSAAENNAGVANATNLFDYANIDKARVVNFYRRYFNDTYSKIFIKAIKINNGLR